MLPTYCPAAGPWILGAIRKCTFADQAAADRGAAARLGRACALRDCGATRRSAFPVGARASAICARALGLAVHCRASRLRRAGEDASRAREELVATEETNPSLDSPAFWLSDLGRALALLTFARGRPCVLRPRLAFSPGCWPRRIKFC
ncbi:hypothetical protein P7K49_014754 [Saguinus oedipus]|uniref:Uncharacterized protein n=1 Tax=Saguinus oedipus TaxID=9490 RepID=A0ABQ9V849_SAGOE|nr:hypothetical protein P7K49_014754 [Saguinus oedipus]